MPFGIGVGIAAGLGKKLLKKVAKKAVTLGKKHAGKIVGAGTTVATIETLRPGTFTGRGGGQGRVEPGANGECPKGFHLNKTKSSDGQPPRSFCTRNRKMNPANGRAAVRAGRRLRRTVKVLRKAFSLTSGKAPKGKFIPRKRR